jgi:predicted dehydrogenase
MVKRLRIGIVGAGFGAIGHLPALRNHPRFEVVAIASPSSAAGIAREAGLPYAFSSCEEMLAGCSVDVVTIASPPFAHAGNVLAALAAGKHVLCEKPFALGTADAQAMLEAAASAGTACGVAHEFRFLPQIQALKELAAHGHLGELRNLEITLLRSSLRRDERRPRSWWFEAQRGGGLAGAVLSHMIDQASWLTDYAPAATLGLRRTANAQREDDQGRFESTVDDGAFALLDYGNGFVARLTADGTTAVESYTCALHGEKRTAVASGPWMTELALYTVDSDETNELTCKPSRYNEYESLGPNVPPLMELYDELLEKIEGKPNALPSFEEALVTQKALAAIGYGT